jgi:hypothetical protein
VFPEGQPSIDERDKIKPLPGIFHAYRQAIQKPTKPANSHKLLLQAYLALPTTPRFFSRFAVVFLRSFGQASTLPSQALTDFYRLPLNPLA